MRATAGERREHVRNAAPCKPFFSVSQSELLTNKRKEACLANDFERRSNEEPKHRYPGLTNRREEERDNVSRKPGERRSFRPQATEFLISP